jgi:hypothetical protein
VKVVPIMIVLALAARVIADTPADDYVAQANGLAKQGDFVGAAGKFKLAYASEARPALICNVGVAYYKAKQLPRAHLFLNRCLERGTALDPKDVASVRKVLESVETALRSGEFTPIDIVVEPAGATIIVQAFGEDESFIGSRVIWLARGKQTLIAKAEGYIDQSVTIDAKGRDLQPVKITLQRAPVEPATGSGSATTTESGSATTTTGSASGSAAVVVPEEKHIALRYERPSKVPALIATSVTVAALAVALVSYQRAHDRAEVAAFAVNTDAYASDKSAVTRWNTFMVTGTVISVAGAGVAGFLWSRAFRSAPIEMQATGSSIAIGGHW